MRACYYQLELIERFEPIEFGVVAVAVTLLQCTQLATRNSLGAGAKK
jgi:hypothetical protein